MFERYTEASRQVVVHAQDVARAHNAATINDEHLLIGLVQSANETTLGYKILRALGVQYDSLLAFIEDHTDRIELSESVRPPMPFSERSKKILELSLREALSLGHNYIGTEHVLLGMVREWGGWSKVYLAELGVTPEGVRDEVIRALSAPRKQAASKDVTDALDEVSDALAAMQTAVAKLKQVLAR